jgi:hypothetical protein
MTGVPSRIPEPKGSKGSEWDEGYWGFAFSCDEAEERDSGAALHQLARKHIVVFGAV